MTDTNLRGPRLPAASGTNVVDLKRPLDPKYAEARLGVIGVGGAGANAVANFLALAEVPAGVRAVVANTDAADLHKVTGVTQLLLGPDRTRGRGAGTDPSVGREAAMESKADIQKAIEGLDVLFIAAGMGKGTGTGAAPLVAEVAEELGILTVAFVYRPFQHEGDAKARVAQEGIERLRKVARSVVVIPNDRMLTLGERVTVRDAFKAADTLLSNGVKGISDLVCRAGHVNVDFADLLTAFRHSGSAVIGMGYATGQGRAAEAVNNALHSPLLEQIDMHGAKSVIVNLTAGDMYIDELNAAMAAVRDHTGPETSLVFGHVEDPAVGDGVSAVVVVTGIPDEVVDARNSGGGAGGARGMPGAGRPIGAVRSGRDTGTRLEAAPAFTPVAAPVPARSTAAVTAPQPARTYQPPVPDPEAAAAAPAPQAPARPTGARPAPFAYTERRS